MSQTVEYPRVIWQGETKDDAYRIVQMSRDKYVCEKRSPIDAMGDTGWGFTQWDGGWLALLAREYVVLKMETNE